MAKKEKTRYRAAILVPPGIVFTTQVKHDFHLTLSLAKEIGGWVEAVGFPARRKDTPVTNSISTNRLLRMTQTRR